MSTKSDLSLVASQDITAFAQSRDLESGVTLGHRSLNQNGPNDMMIRRFRWLDTNDND